MRTIVAGVPNFKDYELFEDKMARHYKSIDRILATDQRGTAMLAHRWARERSIPLDVFTVDKWKNGASAFDYAAKEMLFKAEKIIVFWDTQDLDVLSLLRQGHSRNVPTEVFILRGLSIYG